MKPFLIKNKENNAISIVFHCVGAIDDGLVDVFWYVAEKKTGRIGCLKTSELFNKYVFMKPAKFGGVKK